MGRGKRYNPEHKLNIKKVIATVIALLVIIMFIIIIARLMKPNNARQEKKVALAYYSALENDKWGIINSSGNPCNLAHSLGVKRLGLIPFCGIRISSLV